MNNFPPPATNNECSLRFTHVSKLDSFILKIYGQLFTLQFNARSHLPIDSLSDFPELMQSKNANINRGLQLRESETQDEVSEMIVQKPNFIKGTSYA